MSTVDYYNQCALEYSEHYGILEYRVKGKYMIYNVSRNAYLSNPKYTVQFKVDLDSMEVVSRKRLKRFDKKALVNI